MALGPREWGRIRASEIEEMCTVLLSLAGQSFVFVLLRFLQFTDLSTSTAFEEPY